MAHFKEKINLTSLPGAFVSKDRDGRLLVAMYVDGSDAYYLPEPKDGGEQRVYLKLNCWEKKNPEAGGRGTHFVKVDEKGENLPIIGNLEPMPERGNGGGWSQRMAGEGRGNPPKRLPWE